MADDYAIKFEEWEATLPDLDPNNWAVDERFFDDSSFPVLRKQKFQLGRERYARRRANSLLRSDEPAAVALGEKLMACGQGQRCLSGACLLCGNSRGRGLVLQTAQLFKGLEMALLTVIPSAERFQYENLDEFQASLFVDDFLLNLEEVGLGNLNIVAGQDFAFCVEADEDEAMGPDFWAPHWHSIVDQDNGAEVARRLRARYKRTALVNMPVVVKRIVKTPVKAMLYLFKTRFDIRYFGSEPFERRARKETIEPSADQYEPLMLALDRTGLDGRIIVQTAL